MSRKAPMQAPVSWRTIDTAPKDGTLVKLKRVTPSGREIIGEGLFGTLHDHAPSRQPLGLDPLGRLKAADYKREAEHTKKWSALAKWLRPDRMYAFPEPTHWMLLEGGRSR